jgi:DNA-binding FadR family transcriptional regulator
MSSPELHPLALSGERSYNRRDPDWSKLVDIGTTVAGPRGRELAAVILTTYVDGATAPGTRLPTERQLADELGVSRAAVRLALAYLEAEGRVSREVGRGTFLRAAADAADDIGPADVMTARELFEPQVVPLVVVHATARDFAEVDHCLRGGEAADSVEEWERWDAAFHRAIVVAAHNRLLLRMYGSIEAARHGPLWGNLKQSNDSPERRVVYREDHRRIVDALRAREVEQALEATRVHLERVRANLLGPAGVPA